MTAESKTQTDRQETLQSTFARLKEEGKKAFVPFNLLGYPSRESCLNCLLGLIEGGATALELGIPFSDPIADGPLIQQASHTVLKSGFTVDQALSIVKEVKKRHPQIPVIILTYYNIALARGADTFLKHLKEAGVDGITFVDLPVEEFEEIHGKIVENGLSPVMLISPLTPEERLAQILKYATGFLYLISRAGVTGMQDSYHQHLSDRIKSIKKLSSLPVLVGFGISTTEQAQSMINLGADGVIVGSKILDLINHCEREKEKVAADSLRDYTAAMVESINSINIKQ